MYKGISVMCLLVCVSIFSGEASHKHHGQDCCACEGQKVPQRQKVTEKQAIEAAVSLAHALGFSSSDVRKGSLAAQLMSQASRTGKETEEVALLQAFGTAGVKWKGEASSYVVDPDSVPNEPWVGRISQARATEAAVHLARWAGFRTSGTPRKNSWASKLLSDKKAVNEAKKAVATLQALGLECCNCKGGSREDL